MKVDRHLICKSRNSLILYPTYRSRNCIVALDIIKQALNIKNIISTHRSRHYC